MHFWILNVNLLEWRVKQKKQKKTNLYFIINHAGHFLYFMVLELIQQKYYIVANFHNAANWILAFSTNTCKSNNIVVNIPLDLWQQSHDSSLKVVHRRNLLPTNFHAMMAEDETSCWHSKSEHSISFTTDTKILKDSSR